MTIKHSKTRKAKISLAQKRMSRARQRLKETGARERGPESLLKAIERAMRAQAGNAPFHVFGEISKGEVLRDFESAFEAVSNPADRERLKRYVKKARMKARTSVEPIFPTGAPSPRPPRRNKTEQPVDNPNRGKNDKTT